MSNTVKAYALIIGVAVLLLMLLAMTVVFHSLIACVLFVIAATFVGSFIYSLGR